MFLKSFRFLSLSLMASCATGPSITVLERSDSYSTKPAWATIDNPSQLRDGKRFFTGYVTLEGADISKSAAMNMSDEKAFSEPMRSLVDQFLDQNQVGEELRSSANVGQRVISATRGWRPPMPSLEIVNRYYETVIVTLPDQSFKYETRVFSRASVDVADYEKAKRAYFDRLNGVPEVKKILDDVGAKQRDAVMSQGE